MIRTYNSFVPPKNDKRGGGYKTKNFFARPTCEIIFYPHFKIRGAALEALAAAAAVLDRVLALGGRVNELLIGHGSFGVSFGGI